MLSKVVKMGFEGQQFIGAAGNTAATQILNARDCSYGISHERASTTVRGDGMSIPVGTESVTAIMLTYSFTMLNKPTDANVATLMAAVATGAPIALRTKDHSAGKGYDGDVTVEVTNGQPINGEQSLEFTCTPTADGGRAPQAYV